MGKIDAELLLKWLYDGNEKFVESCSMYQSSIFGEIRKKITDKIFELSNVGLWNEDLDKAPKDRRIMLVKRLNNEIVIQNLESLKNGAIKDQFVKWAELPDVN